MARKAYGLYKESKKDSWRRDSTPESRSEEAVVVLDINIHSNIRQRRIGNGCYYMGSLGNNGQSDSGNMSRIIELSLKVTVNNWGEEKILYAAMYHDNAKNKMIQTYFLDRMNYLFVLLLIIIYD